jgi:hypothetical protein
VKVEEEKKKKMSRINTLRAQEEKAIRDLYAMLEASSKIHCFAQPSLDECAEVVHMSEVTMGKHLDEYSLSLPEDIKALGNHQMEKLSASKKRVKCPNKNYVFKIPNGLQDRLLENVPDDACLFHLVPEKLHKYVWVNSKTKAVEGHTLMVIDAGRS